MFGDLLASAGVREELSLGGAVGVMAIHGGLEAGTAEAAARVAELAGATRYAVVQPDDLRWHVPSIRFDPTVSDKLRTFLDHVALAVSFHGFGRRGFEETVLLGGRNRRVAGLIEDAIVRRSRLAVVASLDAIPPALRGVHASNPVNLPRLGGVQIELSPGAREPKALDAVVEAVASVAAGEMGTLCASPTA